MQFECSILGLSQFRISFSSLKSWDVVNFEFSGQKLKIIFRGFWENKFADSAQL